MGVNMGLDVYCGTLIRYYSRNWLTSVQQWGIENGFEVRMVRENDRDPASLEEITAGVLGWKQQLLRIFAPSLTKPVVWNEDNEITPYYTNKPDWCAYYALLAYVCAHIVDKPLAQTIPKDYNFWKDPLYELYCSKEREGITLFECEWWLPIADEFMWKGYLPTGHERVVGTVGMLEWELEQINSIEWKADEQTILSWTDNEGYPDDAYYTGQKVQMEQMHTEYDTLSLAKFAYSIMYRAVKHSKGNGTLIIIDY